ncbi:DUF1343 domain-containing protein [Rheinheimera sp.]|uniref:exo-beta-N-acetylmuramidase NamZ family protein n=1 Tax=Rheinheimera sp. TaxID=1869214 RepID=UPI00307F34C2
MLTGLGQYQQWAPQLKGKKLGVVVNPSSQWGGCHLLDLLPAAGLQISAIFAPEHGVRGNEDAGARISHSRDEQLNVPVWSLYGKHKMPSPAQLSGIDVLLFDLQDVGVRYYTYLSTLHYLMQAAAQAKIPLWVLDRPNPNGAYLDGPTLKPEFRSFVGIYPIPLLHGMTLGELALMVKGEGWLPQAQQLKLQVIPVQEYRREQSYQLPVKPSPNLPNAQAVALYPSLGFFEATSVSVGRGTATPFQLFGHPTVKLGKFSFTPVATPGAASKPLGQNQRHYGVDLQQAKVNGFSLQYLLLAHQAFSEADQELISSSQFFDRLAGTDKLRKQLAQGLSEQQIRQSWQAELDQFRLRRRPYLLYPDYPPVTP